MTKISIIVPIYNCESYLEECLKSVSNQSLKEVEIICVDDASSDESVKIVRQYAERDSRIRLIQHDKNLSAAKSRKDGVLSSKGQYILFVDGDDMLNDDACEYLYDRMEQQQVDIFHFGTAICAQGVTPQRLRNMEQFVRPYEGKLKNEEVFEACFRDGKYRFNLWNKIYEGEFCRNVFNEMEDLCLPKANDLYAFFYLAYRAQSYSGSADKVCYNYRFGAGSTGKSQLTLEHLETYCQESYVAAEIYAFLNKNKVADKYADILISLKDNLVGECVWNWWEHLPRKYAAQGFDLLVKYWGALDVIESIGKKIDASQQRVCKAVKGAECLEISGGKVKRLGIFYHRYALGGVQRVISLLIPMYLEMGYEVVLITEEKSEEYDYPLPESVRRYLIDSAGMRAENYHQRGVELSEILKKEQLDVMLYHASYNPILLYDILLCKTAGVPVVLTVHDLFSQKMVNQLTYITNRPYVFSLADEVTTLSNTERTYWAAQGINSSYIPNPVETIDEQAEYRGSILWIARLDYDQKQYEDAVEIMNIVVREIPDARLKIVGNEVTPGAVDRLKELIGLFELEHNVELCGQHREVGRFYREASLHLMTSAYESFPMTVVESKCYGLPLVCYDMPYVEMLSDDGSYICVDQGDRKAAAEAVIDILTTPGKVEEMGEAARLSIRKFADFDLKGAWESVFQRVAAKNYSNEYNRYTDNIIKTILFHYEKGVISDISRHHRELQALEERIKGTATFRIGAAILWLPRKLTGGIRCVRAHGLGYTIKYAVKRAVGSK